jgi:hypothetical protein
MTRVSYSSIGAVCFDDVDQDYLAGQFLLCNALSGGRADITGADDRDFVDHFPVRVKCVGCVGRAI